MAGGYWYRGQIDRFTRNIVDALSVLGYYAMADAYKQRGFQHRTRNLHDSYGSAVYVNGRVVLSSIKYFGGTYSKQVDTDTGKTGRQTLNDYFKSVNFTSRKDEIILIVVAAMHYAEYLEEGKYGRDKKQRKKIQVVSVAQNYIRDNYASALSKVYAKYGLKGAPSARVISGNKIQTV